MANYYSFSTFVAVLLLMQLIRSNLIMARLVMSIVDSINPPDITFVINKSETTHISIEGSWKSQTMATLTLIDNAMHVSQTGLTSIMLVRQTDSFDDGKLLFPKDINMMINFDQPANRYEQIPAQADDLFLIVVLMDTDEKISWQIPSYVLFALLKSVDSSNSDLMREWFSQLVRYYPPEVNVSIILGRVVETDNYSYSNLSAVQSLPAYSGISSQVQRNKRKRTGQDSFDFDSYSNPELDSSQSTKRGRRMQGFWSR